MSDDYSELCSALQARLKRIQPVLKRGCAIGSAMIFDSALGEIIVIIHTNMDWYNDDNRQEVHLEVLGQTYKGKFIDEAFYKFKQTFTM